MSPSEVAAYLAEMRRFGCADLNVTTHDGRHFSAKLGPEPAAAAGESGEPAAEEELPPGAFDPIAARKRAR